MRQSFRFKVCSVFFLHVWYMPVRTPLSLSLSVSFSFATVRDDDWGASLRVLVKESRGHGVFEEPDETSCDGCEQPPPLLLVPSKQQNVQSPTFYFVERVTNVGLVTP